MSLHPGKLWQILGNFYAMASAQGQATVLLKRQKELQSGVNTGFPEILRDLASRAQQFASGGMEAFTKGKPGSASSHAPLLF
jgi:hypothetical protein